VTLDNTHKNWVHRRFPGKAALISKEEVVVITEAVRHAIDHLDSVVDAFDQIGA
jgi:hypothetical protein